MRNRTACVGLALTGLIAALGLGGCNGGGTAGNPPEVETIRIRDFRGDGGGSSKPLPDFANLQTAQRQEEKWGATGLGPWSAPHEFRVGEGRVQWYEVRVETRGGRWLATLQPTSNDRDCDLFVFEPTAQDNKDQLDLIGWSNRAPAGGINPPDWVSWRQEMKGRHQIGVTGYDAAGGQPAHIPYTMEIDRVRRLEVNGDWLGPTPMEGGVLDQKGSDWFWFTAQAGTPYQVILRSNSGDADLFVYEQTSSELVGSSDQVSPLLDQVWFVAAQSGLHHVRVCAVADSQYCISVQEGTGADEWSYELFEEEVPDLPPEDQPPLIPIIINGCNAGNKNRVTLHHRAGAAESWPAVFSLYSSGYIRLTPADPGMNPGTSVLLGPGYWEDDVYHHNPTLSEIRITGDFHAGATLALTASGATGKFSVEYEVTLNSPSQTQMTCHVAQTWTCSQALSLDETHQALNEALKLVQLSSMYMDGDHYDADAMHYVGNTGYRRKDLADVADGLPEGGRFIWNVPRPMAQSWLEAALFVQCGWQGAPTPSVSITLTQAPPPAGCVPQGRMDPTPVPTRDNVTAWINWNDAPLDWAAGDSLTIQYDLEANDSPRE